MYIMVRFSRTRILVRHVRQFHSVEEQIAEETLSVYQYLVVHSRLEV